MSAKDLIAECSQIIYDGFIRYNNHFHRMTKRARTRFEQRDWKGHQQDIVDKDTADCQCDQVTHGLSPCIRLNTSIFFQASS